VEKVGSPSNDKPCHYVGKSPKINTHTLVLLINIYYTDISAQKDANTLSICPIGFTYSPIHQSRHNYVFFRNYCAGGTLKETGVRALICVAAWKNQSHGQNLRY
jgi:hypothetical protein